MLWTSAVEIYMQARFRFEMPEGRLLWLIAQHETVTATQLCELAFMRKFQVSRSLEKLRKLGLVGAITSPEDSRSKFVTLTPLGVSVSVELLDQSVKWADYLEQDLTQVERKSLESALNKMRRNAASLTPIVETELLAVTQRTQKQKASAKRRSESSESSQASAPPHQSVDCMSGSILEVYLSCSRR